MAESVGYPEARPRSGLSLPQAAPQAVLLAASLSPPLPWGGLMLA